MFRLFIISITLIFVSLIAGWVGSKPGTVEVSWLGYNVFSSVPIAIIFLLVLFFSLIASYKIFSYLMSAKNNIKNNILIRREDKSLDSLNKGIVALISGDGQSAEKFSNKTENIPKNLLPLKLLLSAHSAHLNKNNKGASKYFEQMLDYKDLEFLGLRGLMLQAKSELQKIKYARRAYSINPNSEWILSNLFKLEIKSGNWRESEKILKICKQKNIYYFKNLDHKISISIFQQAINFNDEEKIAKSKRLVEAFNLSKNIIPLSVCLAKDYLNNNRPRKAIKVIEGSWSSKPHPDLFNLYKKIFKDENPGKFLRRTLRLCESQKKDNPEVCIVQAESYFFAGDHSKARKILTSVIENQVDKRAIDLIIKIDDKDNGPFSEKKWASNYKISKLPTWVCQICDFSFSLWLPLCKKCDAFDSFVWKYKNDEDIKGIDLQKENIVDTNIIEIN